MDTAAAPLDRVVKELGPDWRRELVQGLLRSGHFVFLLDDLSALPSWAAEASSQLGCGILVAGRQSFPGFIPKTVIQPRMFDETAVSMFLTKHSPGKVLNPAVLAACSVGNGQYSPLLIKLAALGGSTEVSRPADIFEDALRALLRGDPELRSAAEQLCLDGFWRDGQRELGDRATPETLDRLEACGLLVPVVGSNRRRVFHDVVLYYLTARTLMREPERTRNLIRAAGDPIFRSADGMTLGSLFGVWVGCCLGPEDATSVLLETLEEIAESHAEGLRARTVWQAAPDGSTRATSSRDAVREASQTLREISDPNKRLEACSRLFLGLAAELSHEAA